jgi:hypothetical protein
VGRLDCPGIEPAAGEASSKIARRNTRGLDDIANQLIRMIVIAGSEAADTIVRCGRMSVGIGYGP